MEQIGVDGMIGEKGFTSLERRWARPTLDINGLTSGYQGEGAKTVLPARASAKFSFRLVPHQNPSRITTSLRSFLEARLPPGIRNGIDRSPRCARSRDSPRKSVHPRRISGN